MLSENWCNQEFSWLQKCIFQVSNDSDKNLGAESSDKEQVITECKRQPFDIKTYLKLSFEEAEMLMAKIQNDKKECVYRFSTFGVWNSTNQILQESMHLQVTVPKILWI